MKIGIVEDHTLLRELLRDMCSLSLGLTVVTEAATGKEALESIVQTGPTILLLDIRLADMSGFDLIRTINKLIKGLRILVLSGYCDPFTVLQIEQASVSGFVDKCEITIPVLKTAIQAVIQGGVYFSPTYRHVQANYRGLLKRDLRSLTEREWIILEMVADGLTDREVAHSLKISERTVETHRLNAMRKLRLAGKTELQRWLRDCGFTRALAE